MSTLKKRFIDGLASYGVSFDDILNNKWKYCGGDEGRHHNHFIIACAGREKPPHADACVCGHHLRENCYITDDESFIVVGNCCINRFITLSARTCCVCDKPHKNRTVNRCNDCRKGMCDKCNGICDPKYKSCYKFFIKD